MLGATDDDALRAYQESTTLELRGPLDTDALQRALQAAVNRHEALRALVQPEGESQRHPSGDDGECATLIDLSDNPGVSGGCAGRESSA